MNTAQQREDLVGGWLDCVVLKYSALINGLTEFL